MSRPPKTTFANDCASPTARSQEDKTRNSPRNGKRNPNWNRENIVAGLFSSENYKLDIILPSNDHFKSYLFGNGPLLQILLGQS